MKHTEINRDALADLREVKATDPKGTARTLRFERNLENPHLDIKWAVLADGRVVVESLSLKEESLKEGWALVL